MNGGPNSSVPLPHLYPYSLSSGAPGPVSSSTGGVSPLVPGSSPLLSYPYLPPASPVPSSVSSLSPSLPHAAQYQAYTNALVQQAFAHAQAQAQAHVQAQAQAHAHAHAHAQGSAAASAAGYLAQKQRIHQMQQMQMLSPGSAFSLPNSGAPLGLSSVFPSAGSGVPPLGVFNHSPAPSSASAPAAPTPLRVVPQSPSRSSQMASTPSSPSLTQSTLTQSSSSQGSGSGSVSGQNQTQSQSQNQNRNANAAQSPSQGQSRDYRSIIECGCVDVQKGHRVLSMYSEYFGKEMEIYTADNDPQVRILFRASTLAEKFDCATNKVGMYLQRRRHADAGIFQAVAFRGKPSGKTGLKVGAYFLSLQACKDFESHFHQQSLKRDRALERDGKGVSVSGVEDDEPMDEQIDVDGEGEEVSTSVSSSGGSRLNSLHTTDMHSRSSSMSQQSPIAPSRKSAFASLSRNQ